MEERHLIAYLLIAAVAAFLLFAYRRATRERRAAHNALRAHLARRKDRARAAGGP